MSLEGDENDEDVEIEKSTSTQNSKFNILILRHSLQEQTTKYSEKFRTISKKLKLGGETQKRILIGISAIIFVLIMWLIFDRKTPINDFDEIGRPLSHAPEGYTFNKEPYSYEKSKKILLLNPRRGQADWGIGTGNEPFYRQECRVQNCFLTSQRNLLGEFGESNFDAILFYVPGLGKNDFSNFPKIRRSGQRYVMVTDEPPKTKAVAVIEELNGFFNWTMTYRQDSDLPSPAGRILHVNKELVHIDHKHMIGWNHLQGIKSLSSEGISHNRSNIVAWYVNDCDSLETHRQDFVSFLSNYIKVDIYGPCGNLDCPGELNGNPIECTKELSKQYKFILSFEKSFCRDFVSDYFFQVMNLPIVPIVMGSGDYTKIAPTKSFINVNDFTSAKELANYLLYLEENEAAYLAFFKWKDHFRVVQRDPICGICEMLNSNLPSKSYKNIEAWFVKSSHCQKGIDMPWMIASLADEIEEKAERKSLQKSANNIDSSILNGEVQLEDADDFVRRSGAWRPQVVQMPGDIAAPPSKESIQRMMDALLNTEGETVTNVESKSYKSKKTKEKIKDLKKSHIFRDKAIQAYDENLRGTSNSQVDQVKKEQKKQENIQRLRG